MRLLTIVLFLSCMQALAASGYSQYVSLNCKNEKLESVFQKIEKQTGYSFFYNDQLLQNVEKVNVTGTNVPLKELLDQLLRPRGLGYTIDEKYLVINKLNEPHSTNENKQTVVQSSGNLKVEEIVTAYPIRGTVKNEQGEPIPAASVVVFGTKKGISTNQKGEFTIDVEVGYTLVITAVGYASEQIKITNQDLLNITLKQMVVSNEVVVVNTGMYTRKKESYTGAASTYTGNDLRKIGNVDLIQSLRSLDPSFLLMENNMAGSNPNVLPTIELRGQTSITTNTLTDEFSNNPNQPLFILDGFESNLKAIQDLDMNQVASINILKDAAATSIYGSKASNGVIVVETKRPVSGTLRLRYIGDFNVQLPDLSSYNIMNAAEKLEFERLSGVYVAPISIPELQNSYFDPLYNTKLQAVLSGVNSYWLSDPLQTGFSQKHALYAEGGSDNFSYNIGGSYKNLKGAMIGSGNKEWNGRANLSYRKNKLNINNNLLISGYRQDESNYGSFSTWVDAQPYYKKADAGTKYLFTFHDYTLSGLGDSKGDIYVSNPLYNATLNSYNHTKNTTITNNFQLIYHFTNKLDFQAGIQLLGGNTESEVFLSPKNTAFDNTALLNKGTYNYSNIKRFSYTGNAKLSYVTTIHNDHLLQATIRTELANNQFTKRGFLLQGFPLSSNGNPRFAYAYNTVFTDGLESTSANRRHSSIANLFYSYRSKYNAEFSFTYDGSTAFGQKNLYQPFTSLGLSWNLNKEDFLIDKKWVQSLRVRASYGITGNQNFTSTSSTSTFHYLSSNNYSGQGVELVTLGNPDLAWQKTYQTNVGLDASLWNSRFVLTFDAYHKYTNPMVVALTLPASTALENYPMNLGTLTTKGIEANIRFAPWYKPKERKTWFIGFTGTSLKGKFGGIGNQLEGVNSKLAANSSLTRYQDGYDSYDLWAVQSLGIDPATGKEIFLKKDGTQTFTYSGSDKIKVGNSRPALQGVISNSVTFNGFIVNMYFRYIARQDVLNEALYNKVENINIYDIINSNQDKRALYERWKQVGDISQFKAISLTSSTPMSSRFIQTENSLSFESINVGYDFTGRSLLNKLSLSSLRITAYTNDVFRISSVKRERGTDYPYARSFSLGINATFK